MFISYAREDSGSALALHDSLKKAGCDPWIDQVHILPGQRWRTRIKEALKEADFFIACLSKCSVSKIGFFQTELKEAYEVLKTYPNENIFLIPARFDDCDVPADFEGLNWVDLYQPQGFQRLFEAIRSEAPRRGLELSANLEKEAVSLWVGSLVYPDQARLRIRHEGAFFLFDLDVVLLLDGREVGRGSVMNGFDFMAVTTTGDHTLLMRHLGKWPALLPDNLNLRYFSFSIPKPGLYEAHISFKRLRRTDYQLELKEFT
ncbi:MAG TPA: toll/interleukin-1 receptor domain-containing protein [Thermoanaerobaculia bacterium]|nr:toll/interleukin-1 receptor domain-containing protein [Thermoanaerobaculia bacterium]